MITFLIGMVLKTMFDGVILVVRTLFGSLWTGLASRMVTILAMPSVGVGLGLYDVFVGIDFTVWGLGLAVTIIVTTRLLRLILGLFSKG
jgi:hypothetical protein